MAASQRLYRELAKVIRRALNESYSCAYAVAVSDVAKGIADVLKWDNRAFRYDRFFPACGLDSWGEILPTPVHPNGFGRAHD
jgi:hypothetical protein